MDSDRKRYRIAVKGRLSERFASAFDARVELAPGQTVLIGSFSERAELDVLVRRLQDLGIELVSVDAS